MRWANGPILWGKKVRPSEECAQHHIGSGGLEFDVYWPEPEARLGCRAPSPPPGPMDRLFPLCPGAAGEWTEGVSGCLLSSVISHPRMRRWRSSTHHLLPTQQGSSCILLPDSACSGHWQQRQPPTPQGCQGKKGTQLESPLSAPEPTGWRRTERELPMGLCGEHTRGHERGSPEPGPRMLGRRGGGGI